MKFALGEKEVIVQKKAREEAEKKVKTLNKEKEDIQGRLKASTADKVKMQQLSDSRLQDILVFKREVEKMREEAKIMEAKVMVAETRLREECDAHRETRTQMEDNVRHLSQTRAEIENTKRECQEFMQRMKGDEKRSEQEQTAKLIIDAAAASELESLRDRHKKAVEENGSLSVKVQALETERLKTDAEISRLKETVSGQKKQISDLLAEVAEMESLRSRLQREEDHARASKEETESSRQEVKEAMEDMAACRRKEAELLEYTQKLTDKNVTLQSELTALEARASGLEAEHARLASTTGDLEASLSQTSAELSEEKKRRKNETEILAKKLAEKSKQVEALSTQTLDAENEVQVLKRKNAASLRELTRELQTCQKRLQEVTGPSNQDALSRSSRTSSNTSINRSEDQGRSPEGAISPNNNHEVGSNGLLAPNSYSRGQVSPKLH